jgi:RNA polymerase sigma factor (TIGR02999 family)
MARPGARLEPMSAGPDITEFLERAAQGDGSALDALIPHIYATLRQLARRQRVGEPAHTLETTALVHEAYLSLARQSGLEFSDRAHFYSYMSRVMRHLLIDRVRRSGALKRQPADAAEEGPESAPVDLFALDEALNQLATRDRRLARVAELRLFAGLSALEIAEITGVTARTVERDWLKARTFLAGCLLPEA